VLGNPRRLPQPHGYLDLINEAFDVCKQSGFASLAIACALYIPYWALFGLFSEVTLLAPFFMVGLLGVPVAAHAAMIRLQYERYLGNPYPGIAALQAMLRRAVPLVITSLMAGIAFTVALLALVLPALILYVGLFFLYHVIMVEDAHYRRAFQRSWELTGGPRGRALVGSILAVSPYAIFAGLMASAILWTGAGTEPEADSSFTTAEDLAMGSFVGFLCASLAVIPTAVSVVFYVDARVRREGFDIEWLARGAGLSEERSPEGEAARGAELADGGDSPREEDTE
jgi:hypothetical protein